MLRSMGDTFSAVGAVSTPSVFFVLVPFDGLLDIPLVFLDAIGECTKFEENSDKAGNNDPLVGDTGEPMGGRAGFAVIGAPKGIGDGIPFSSAGEDAKGGCSGIANAGSSRGECVAVGIDVAVFKSSFGGGANGGEGDGDGSIGKGLRISRGEVGPGDVDGQTATVWSALSLGT